jgi:hypothetical protein
VVASRRRVFRWICLAAAAYPALFVADLAHQLAWKKAARESHSRGTTPGQYVLDPELGYALRPGFVGEYAADLEGHEGRPRPIRVNSLGHRDEEPGAVDTLLVGDSFTFGLLLAQEDTVSAQASRISGRRFYNAGVMGYDPEQIRVALERALPVVRPKQVAYLFYENDLMFRARWYRITEAGQLQMRFASGGWWPEEHGANFPVVAWESADLRGLRGRRLPPLYTPRGATHADVIRAADCTVAMEKAARRYGASFRVLVVPSVEEAATGRTFEAIEAYSAIVRNRGVEVASVQLERTDFFAVDQHCNARGAEQIARAAVAATGGAYADSFARSMSPTARR